MKITFLGTSAGIPDPDRHCSSAMIEAGGRAYVIDAGAPLLDCLRQQGLILERSGAERIAAMFTTHAHGDHTAGLLQMLSACNWFFRTSSFDVFLTKDGLGDALVECINLMDVVPFAAERLRIRRACAGVVYDDGILRATYIPTKHCLPDESYAILIEAEGKKVLFSGDLSHNLEENDVPSILHEAELDLFVCELVHFKPQHLTPYLDACRAKDVRFNHFSPKERIEEMTQIAKEKGYPFSVSFLCDGDVVEWN